MNCVAGGFLGVVVVCIFCQLVGLDFVGVLVGISEALWDLLVQGCEIWRIWSMSEALSVRQILDGLVVSGERLFACEFPIEDFGYIE